MEPIDTRSRVYYEWTAEREDEWGDIQDSNFADTLAALLPFAKEGWALGLVRNVGCESEGVEDRQWAYPKDGVLPERFDGGSKVPQRFLAEWKRHCA